MKKASEAGLIALLVVSVVVVAVLVYSAVQNQLEREYKRGYLAGKADEAKKFEGVDTKLAREMISEQQASRVNMRRLVDGEITDIAVNNVDKDKTDAIAYITARYIDGTTLKGTAELMYKDGYWYMVKITQEKKK